MSKNIIGKTSIPVRPATVPSAGSEMQYYDTQQLARFIGRLSYMVAEKIGLTPSQLADVVKTLDTYAGLDE